MFLEKFSYRVKFYTKGGICRLRPGFRGFRRFAHWANGGAADAAGWDRLSAAGCVEGPRKKVLKIDTCCAGEGS